MLEIFEHFKKKKNLKFYLIDNKIIDKGTAEKKAQETKLKLRKINR